MRRVAFIMRDAKITQEMTLRRSGDICAKIHTVRVKASMSGMN